MKSALLKVTLTLLVAGSLPASAQQVGRLGDEGNGSPWGHVDAVCVGGPVKPSFAYANYDEANACAQQVASYSRACANAVRVGPCAVDSEFSIDAVEPPNCTCPGGRVGSWE